MKRLSLVLAVLIPLAAALTVSPSSGDPGTSFVVRGSGFVPREAVRIFWDGTRLAGTAKVEANGTFSYAGAVPAGAAPGPHRIRAEGNKSTATATFTVAAPATTSTTSTPSTTSPPTTAPPTTAPPTTPPPTSSTTAGSPGSTTSPSTTAARPGSTTVPTATGGTTTLPGAAAPGLSTTLTTTATSSSSTSEPARSEPGAPPASKSGVGTAIVLALVTLGLVSGVAYLLARRRAGAEAAQAAKAPAAAEAVGAIPAVDQQEGRWIRSRAGLPSLGQVEGLTGIGSGFVAVGETASEEGSQPRAAVWKSANGRAWELLTELDPGRATLGIPWRRGLLVIGTAGHGPQASAAAWWSGNGRTWQRMTTPDDPRLAGVIFDGAAAGREVVVAYGRGPQGPGAWVSPDGERWVPSSLEGGIDLVARIGGGFLAFGRHLAERRPVVAVSPDGSDWTELTHDQVFMFEGVAMAAVVGFDGGLVAAGTDKMRSAATVWVSDDGVRWHRTPFEPDPGTSIAHLVLHGDRLLAVGADSGRRRTGRPATVAIWESRDAVSWARAEDSPLFATATATDVAVSTESVLIFGTLLPGRGSPWPEAVAVTWSEAARAEAEEPSPPPGELAAVGSSVGQAQSP